LFKQNAFFGSIFSVGLKKTQTQFFYLALFTGILCVLFFRTYVIMCSLSKE